MTQTTANVNWAGARLPPAAADFTMQFMKIMKVLRRLLVGAALLM
jgi:hypothetical protein